MDETPAEPEPTQAEMRQEIDETRSALTDKLAALESQVMNTVASARETVEESIQSSKDSVEETFQSVKTSVGEAVTAVKNTFDVRRQVKQHPWAMVGGAFLTGLAVGDLLKRVKGRNGPVSGRTVKGADRYRDSTARTALFAGNGTPPSVAALPNAVAPAAREPHFLDRFQEEVDQVKAIASGWVLGLVSESIKDTLPQYASEIDRVRDSLTAKLGGQVRREPCTND